MSDPLAAGQSPALRPANAAALMASPLPPWASGYKLRTDKEGRPFLHAEVDGFDVWAQPKAWSMMTLLADSARDEAGPVNYGLQLGRIADRAGHLETNDPHFGRELLGAKVGRESPMPDLAPRGVAEGPGVLPAAIVAGGLLLAALVVRLKRKGR